MVQAIDGLKDAGIIRFRVHRSSRDHDLMLGSWQHAVDEDEHRMGSIGQNLLGGSVEIEYQRAWSWAAQHDVPFLWVDDPNGLFPPAKRPLIAV